MLFLQTFICLAFLQSTPLTSPLAPVQAGSGVSAAVSSSSVVLFLGSAAPSPSCPIYTREPALKQFSPGIPLPPISLQNGMTLQFGSSPVFQIGSMLFLQTFICLAALQSTPLIPLEPLQAGSGVSEAVSSSSVVLFLGSAAPSPSCPIYTREPALKQFSPGIPFPPISL